MLNSFRTVFADDFVCKEILWAAVKDSSSAQQDMHTLLPNSYHYTISMKNYGLLDLPFYLLTLKWTKVSDQQINTGFKDTELTLP